MKHLKKGITLFFILAMTWVVEGASIAITSPFPSGEVFFRDIHITYTATPAYGAYIREVYYRINGGHPRVIYNAHRGNLGYARVTIRPGERNHFIFYVRDSLGNRASYVVRDAPHFTPRTIDDEPRVQALPDRPGFLIASNLLILDINPEIDSRAINRYVYTIFNTLDGQLITHHSRPGTLRMYIPADTPETVRAMEAYLQDNYSHVFRSVSVYYYICFGSWFNPQPPRGLVAQVGYEIWQLIRALPLGVLVLWVLHPIGGACVIIYVLRRRQKQKLHGSGL